MKVSNIWSETGLKMCPWGPPLGIIVGGQVLVKVDWMADRAYWVPLKQWELSREQ